MDETVKLATKLMVEDVIACWPEAWREDFREQNELLAEDGEELLSPAEYLQCRADDLEEFEYTVAELRKAK